MYKGHGQELMMSLFTKESAYDGGVTMNDTNSCGMRGFGPIKPDHADEVQNDKDTVNGTEFGTNSEITSKAAKMTLNWSRATPNVVAGMAALVLGSVTTTQDGANNAYKHNIVPVAVGTALPSIQTEHKIGGVQTKYTGVKGDSLIIKGAAGGLVACGGDVICSGTRATSATAFTSPISESWMHLSNCKVWMESGAAISIDAVPVQGSENISSGTPTSMDTLIRDFEFKFMNNPAKQIGFGSAVGVDCDFQQRAVELNFSMLFSGQTYLDYFLNQTALAIEFDLKGAQIDGGTMYYGFHLIIPRFKLKAEPVPEGGISDFLTAKFDCDIQDDGTNDVCIIEAYNQVDGYLG